MILIDLEQRLVKIREMRDQKEAKKAIEAAFLEGYPSPSIVSIIGIPPQIQSDMMKGNWPAETEDELTKLFAFCCSVISELKVQPVFKMVDTCAGEFESATPYYYGTFEQENDAVSVRS